MLTRRLRRFAVRCSGLALMLIACAANAAPDAVIGILQGPAVLIRESTRYVLVEGAALADGDIVETGKGAFMQIEFENGTLLSVGEATRLLLAPKLTALKTSATPRLYLLDGWIKPRLPSQSQTAFTVLSPRWELAARSGAAAVRLQPAAWGVFAETGAMRLVQRNGPAATFELNMGDYASLREGNDKPAISRQLPHEFVDALPRNFRDPLPSRRALYDKRSITLRPIGTVTYEDVSAWLHTERGLRLALSRQWRGRAADKAFRAAAAANLPTHPEWERVLFPERFLPKKPPPAPPPVVPVSPGLPSSAPGP